MVAEVLEKVKEEEKNLIEMIKEHGLTPELVKAYNELCEFKDNLKKHQATGNPY